jgi:hypothetical protein
MATTTGRTERAERRSASRSRAAAKPKDTRTVTVETDDDGGTLMLETEAIRAAGDTPSGATAGNEPGNLGRDANRPAGGSAGGGGTQDHGDEEGDPPEPVQQTDEAQGPTRGSRLPRAARSTTHERGEYSGGTNAGRQGSANTGQERAPPWSVESMGAATEQHTPAPLQPIVVRERAKSLKITKFKGLDDLMPVTMWLKTVRAEVWRQVVTMGVQWRDDQLYHEVAAHLEGEAQRWFATVMESVARENESIGTLASMLKAKYMTRRTTPEVVDLLNARRQMRGERLLEYAQSLREIAEQGDIDEEWLVNAFLKGMSSTTGATHVRGHRPGTLDDAVNLAIPQVGDYGDGYGIGLEAAMAAWDLREPGA